MSSLGYGNSETEFAALKKDIEQCGLINDYAGMLKSIQSAMEVCKRLYDEATTPDKKELMRRNAVQLKVLYKQCKAKLEAQGEKVPEKTSKAVVNKTNNVKKQATTSEKTETKEKDEQAIQYEFNGVDVKGFLTSDSNDVVTFEDVKGMADEKELIEREFFIDDEDRAFKKHFKSKNKNFILLYGVPGTGKTFFAKAISCELKARAKEDEEIPFFSVVGTQLKDSKVGGSEKNIQALFEFCKQFSHCVLFIDEFDSMVPDRAKETGDPTAITTVTTFLQMLDGFSSSKGTLLIAATNCPYNIDGAVLSRANAKIEIPLPDYDVIYSVLDAKIGSELDEEVSLEEIAKSLDGYSNRDISNYINALGDIIFDKYRDDKKQGIIKSPEEYKYEKWMFEKAATVITASTKPSDFKRIKEFKENN